MKTSFLTLLFALASILFCAPLFAQVKEQTKTTQPAPKDTLQIAEPVISDTSSSARIFLDKIEVFGTVAKPQALFILPGSDPTVDGLKIDRSFFKEIFRPVEWEGLKKNAQPARKKLQW